MRYTNRYFTLLYQLPRSKCHFPWGIWTPSNIWFLELTRVSLQTASRSVQSFLYNLQVCPADRHADHTLRTISVAKCRMRCSLMIH